MHHAINLAARMNVYRSLTALVPSWYIFLMFQFYSVIFTLFSPKILFNNMICIRLDWILSLLSPIQQSYTSYFEIIPLLICNRSNMYQCVRSSKCISLHRLFDGIEDCPFMDDENITAINNNALIEQLKQTHYKCQSNNKYIPQIFVNNLRCD
jgi:hypothetical protein